MFNAYAHTGFYELKFLGEFDTEEEAVDALVEEFNRITNEDIIKAYDSIENWGEIYWADSRISYVFDK